MYSPTKDFGANTPSPTASHSIKGSPTSSVRRKVTVVQPDEPGPSGVSLKA